MAKSFVSANIEAGLHGNITTEAQALNISFSEMISRYRTIAREKIGNDSAKASIAKGKQRKGKYLKEEKK